MLPEKVDNAFVTSQCLECLPGIDVFSQAYFCLLISYNSLSEVIVKLWAAMKSMRIKKQGST